jgi:hypothetical protein
MKKIILLIICLTQSLLAFDLEAIIPYTVMKFNKSYYNADKTEYIELLTGMLGCNSPGHLAFSTFYMVHPKDKKPRKIGIQGEVLFLFKYRLV